MSLNYSVKIEQKPFEMLEGLESDYIVRQINNLPNTTLDRDFLEYNNFEQAEQTIYLNKDICGELYRTPSVESTSVPDITNYKYLVKEGFSYTYTKEKPIPDTYIQPEVLYLYHNSTVNFEDVDMSKVFARSLVGELTPQHIDTTESSGTVYDCYNFPYGGISKSYSYFYMIDNTGVLSILGLDDDVLIDYLEGCVYVDRQISQSITQIYGLFNIEPVNIIPKGTFKVNSNSTDFYELQNIPEKQILKVFSIDSNNIGLILSVNAAVVVVSESTNYTIDGVYYSNNQPFIFRKDVIYTLGKADALSNPVLTDFLDTLGRLIGDTTGFSSITSSSYAKKINTGDEEVFLHIFKEVSKNTYNLTRPLIFKVQFNSED